MRRPSRQGNGALALLAAFLPADAQGSSPFASTTCVTHVGEAASRSGLTREIVMRVMLAESGGDRRIVSTKGAIGCMQIMPSTWSYLSARYKLGANPFDARRNMIGGAMYLAELTARYGMPGALAAYNAGPGRYQRYAAGTAVLPAETVAYVARIGKPVARRSAPIVPPRWQEAGLFLARAAAPASAENFAGAGSVADAPAGDRLFPFARLAQSDVQSPAAR